MGQKTIQIIKKALYCLAVITIFSGCSPLENIINSPPKVSNPNYIRQPAPLNMPVYTGVEEKAWQSGEESALLDLSNINKGYVGVKCLALAKARLRVTQGSNEYAYYIATGGEAQFYPLTMGSGEYNFEVLIHLEGTTYKSVISAAALVELENDFSPFLLASTMVNYGHDDKVVKLARELTKNASTNLEAVQQIYHWVENNIIYDTEKAKHLADAEFYAPVLDEILESKKGICLDYAVLTAVLLRINGIPAKLVIGTADTPDEYNVPHAWNLIWLEESGDAAKYIPVNSNQWNRLDLTIAAGNSTVGTKFLEEEICYKPQSEH